MPLFCTLLPLQRQQIFINNALRVSEPVFVRTEFNNLWIENLPHGPKLVVLIQGIFGNDKFFQDICHISSSPKISDQIRKWARIRLDFFFFGSENKICEFI